LDFFLENFIIKEYIFLYHYKEKIRLHCISGSVVLKFKNTYCIWETEVGFNNNKTFWRYIKQHWLKMFCFAVLGIDCFGPPDNRINSILLLAKYLCYLDLFLIIVFIVFRFCWYKQTFITNELDVFHPLEIYDSVKVFYWSNVFCFRTNKFHFHKQIFDVVAKVINCYPIQTENNKKKTEI
jgi:hypothetical protein